MRLLQEWQNELDKPGFVGTILKELSNANDCLPHDPLIAESEADGIGKSGLNLLLSYLSNRKQRAKLNSSYSDWYDIIRGVPQRSILGPLLLNLFINDLFLFLGRTNICNFAEDNTIYRCDSDLEIILEELQHEMKILLDWFKINSMKPNPKKFQFRVVSKGTKSNFIRSHIR